ncbi:hypothetical protein ACFXA2_01615 [Micromonospora chalcea]
MRDWVTILATVSFVPAFASGVLAIMKARVARRESVHVTIAVGSERIELASRDPAEIAEAVRVLAAELPSPPHRGPRASMPRQRAASADEIPAQRGEVVQ